MRQQSRPHDLLDLDRRRDEAADVLRRATTRAGKRYAPVFAPTALSRARQGDPSNPVFRVTQLLIAMQRAGEPYDAAALLLAHFEGLATELWGDRLPPLETAVLDEQAADAQEDVEQVNSLLHPDHMARHTAALERQISRSRVLLAVERREIAGRRKVA